MLDARDPLRYRSEDLEAYSLDLHPTKGSVLLLNKADLLPAALRSAWADYFEGQGVEYVFWSAKAGIDSLTASGEFHKIPDNNTAIVEVHDTRHTICRKLSCAQCQKLLQACVVKFEIWGMAVSATMSYCRMSWTHHFRKSSGNQHTLSASRQLAVPAPTAAFRAHSPSIVMLLHCLLRASTWHVSCAAPAWCGPRQQASGTHFSAVLVQAWDFADAWEFSSTILRRKCMLGALLMLQLYPDYIISELGLPSAAW